jgi:hypothetical protein
MKFDSEIEIDALSFISKVKPDSSICAGVGLWLDIHLIPACQAWQGRLLDRIHSKSAELR